MNKTGTGSIRSSWPLASCPLEHDTRLLLPPNLRDWVPAGHLVHFILDAVGGLDLRQVRVNTRGTGSAQYPPRLLLALLNESFVQVLQLAQALKLLQFGQLTVAADGTKVLANASKHRAVSYARAGEMLNHLELEVAQLLTKAEPADATPLQDGLSIPAEITPPPGTLPPLHLSP